VIEADVILHVRDVSHEDAEAQLADVENILRQLGIDPHKKPGEKRSLVEVWNKIDRLDAAERTRLQNIAERRPAAERPIAVSALTGEGIDSLNAAIEQRLSAGRVLIELDLDPADGAGVSWLHRHTEVIHKAIDDKGRITMTVRADPERAATVRARFACAMH
jgi:GTP-binding protein HflX